MPEGHLLDLRSNRIVKLSMLYAQAAAFHSILTPKVQAVYTLYAHGVALAYTSQRLASLRDADSTI